ncbi:MAG: hypothetical protein ACYDHZ_00520 [Dehalococcoidia bacterium]
MTDKDQCPFCGAVVETVFGVDDWFITFKCGSTNQKDFRRSDQCYEAQLAAQTDLLRQCLKVVEAVAKGECCTGSSYGGATMQHKQMNEAQALLPDLERAVEGEKE